MKKGIALWTGIALLAACLFVSYLPGQLPDEEGGLSVYTSDETTTTDGQIVVVVDSADATAVGGEAYHVSTLPPYITANGELISNIVEAVNELRADNPSGDPVALIAGQNSTGLPKFYFTDQAETTGTLFRHLVSSDGFEVYTGAPKSSPGASATLMLFLDDANGSVQVLGKTAGNYEFEVTGDINAQQITTEETSTTLGAGVTTFAATSNVMTITGDAGANTIATITAGLDGQPLTLLFVDGLVTVTDDNTHGADSIDLSAAFTSADDTSLALVHDGTSWYEVSRSVN